MSYTNEACQDAMARAKIKISSHSNATFFTSLVYQTKHVFSESEEDCPTAHTNGATATYNKNFFMGLDKEERQFLILHETLHGALDHMGRRSDRDHERWNAACDYAINGMLVKANFTMPKGGLHDDKYDGMSADEIYKVLESKKGKTPKAAWDDLNQKPEIGDDYERAEAARSMLVQAATEAKLRNQVGSIPGSIARLVDDILNPLVPWNVVLRRLMTDINKTDYSMSRPNRRFTDYYLPSLHSPALARIDVAIDVSGSINEVQFKQFLGELHHVLRMYKPKRIYVSQFDSVVQHSKLLSSTRELLEIPYKGGGGTELEPVMQDFISSPSRTLIVLTDGYFNTNITDPKKRVIWVVYDNPSFKPNFGTTVHFRL